MPWLRRLRSLSYWPCGRSSRSRRRRATTRFRRRRGERVRGGSPWPTRRAWIESSSDSWGRNCPRSTVTWIPSQGIRQNLPSLADMRPRTGWNPEVGGSRASVRGDVSWPWQRVSGSSSGFRPFSTWLASQPKIQFKKTHSFIHSNIFAQRKDLLSKISISFSFQSPRGQTREPTFSPAEIQAKLETH